MQGKEPILFNKQSIFEFMDPNFPIRWFEFEPDLAIGTVTKNFKAGFFSVRLYIRNVTLDGKIDPASVQLWAKQPKKRPDAWKIRVNIY
jgi:hypothetical protein